MMKIIDYMRTTGIGKHLLGGVDVSPKGAKVIRINSAAKRAEENPVHAFAGRSAEVICIESLPGYGGEALPGRDAAGVAGDLYQENISHRLAAGIPARGESAGGGNYLSESVRHALNAYLDAVERVGVNPGHLVTDLSILEGLTGVRLKRNTRPGATYRPVKISGVMLPKEVVRLNEAFRVVSEAISGEASNRANTAFYRALANSMDALHNKVYNGHLNGKQHVQTTRY